MNDNKKEIQDNCKYCHKPYKEFANGGDDWYASHFDEYGGAIITEDGQGCSRQYIFVHYCPMCGRDLIEKKGK